MLKRKQIVLAGAVLAAMPLVSRAAVTVAYQFDPNDFMYSADGLFDDTITPINTGTTANPVFTVPFSSTGEFAIGLDADVTGDTNPASGTGYDTTHATKQSALLGITSWQVGLTDSAQTKAAVNNQGGSTSTAAVDNPPFAANQASGNTNASGGITASTGVAGALNLAGNKVSTAAQIANTDYGAGAFAELFNGLQISTLAAGQAVFTLTDLDTALQYAHNTSVGTSTVAPTYVDQTFIAGTDTLATLPTLTLNMTGVVTGNNIVSLTSTAPANTAPTAYGATSLGTVTATGTASSYKAGTLVLGTATGTGFVNGVLSGTPTIPTEIYALDIENAAGGVTAPTDLAAIAAAMQAALVAQGFTGSTVSLTPPNSNPFPAGPAGTPGYDVFLTISGLTQAQLSSDFLGFDLTEGSSFSTDKVAAVALVPEPASAAFLLVGASGMLMGRRRRNASQIA
jgi:hypothetical protein